MENVFRRTIRGSRKHQCGECAETFMVKRREHNSRSRLRCPACGSLYVYPYSRRAVEQADERLANVSAADEIESTTIKVSPAVKNPRRCP
jgi:DNA-directed RNA polymerase subunit M/transcription elongation factor TFIIS